MKKILIIQQKMIGDVLLSSLICENIKIAKPEYQIHYLVNHNTLPVLENNPYIDKIIVFEKKQDESFIELIKFSKQLNSEKYDIVIDAYSKLQSWTIVLFNNAKQKISYKKTGRSFLYTNNIIKHNQPKSDLGLAIEHRLLLLQPLDIKINKTFPTLYVTESEKKMASDLFSQHNINNNKKTVMISLLGSDESKTYPLNYMTELVDFIGKQYDVNILFNYFPKQLQQAKHVFDNCSEITKSKIAFNLFGNDLRSFIAIMDRCDMIVGNDGGAINMAKALNKASFIIFSPWIEKKIWATFEDGIKHVSVHLNDFKPELFTNKTTKELKKDNQELYQIFATDLILKKLQLFLDGQVNN
nr:glycosyltransferase family 9 protein [uncultured Flavobacterium sp.]